MASCLKPPGRLATYIDVKNKWLEMLQEAQDTVKADAEVQIAARKGLRLIGRSVPPDVIGKSYAKYCALINKMYDSYLNNVQLQRAPYILEIITVIMKRMYELRDELVHIIVNDYIYVNPALTCYHMVPEDIQIVVPYHFPTQSRSENVEQLLQEMWMMSLKRKRRKERLEKKLKLQSNPLRLKSVGSVNEKLESENGEEEKESISPPPSVHTFIPENYIHSVIIQRHERLRMFRGRDARARLAHFKAYFAKNIEPAPMELQIKAATLIQAICREYMRIKRNRLRDDERDQLLGVLPDRFTHGLSLVEENNKIYEKRRNMRMKIYESYLKDMERERTRLILLKKNNQIDDITDEIREWFKEWFYGYGFFPQYPYEIEGGTIVVVRGDYPTIEEQFDEDAYILATTKGKTKEEIKKEKEQARKDQKLKDLAKLLVAKKAAEQLVKERCNPFSDPGYVVQQSAVMDELTMAIKNYRASWSLFDTLSPEQYGETIYGYLMPLLTEDVMKEIHLECREFIDEMMRLDLKMLIAKHQMEYKNMGWPFPKMNPRKKPKVPPKTKNLNLEDKNLLKGFEEIFDLNIVSKPTTKLSDVMGDSSFAAYDYHIRDPDPTFPVGYGDIKDRLILSCILGCGIQPGAPRKKSVMLLGPVRSGKSFLVDAVAGELNAVKIDITPEVFTAVTERPTKALAQVFLVAKAFQPAVVFMKDIERVFMKKVPSDQKYLNSASIKNVLGNLVKNLQIDDKIIFIASCSDPWVANIKPMLAIFDEIIVVPRTDYASVQKFFFERFQSVRSLPRNFPVQPLAQLFQGYVFADIINIYNEVMAPERIVRLNIKPLSPEEFLEVALKRGLESVSVEDYRKYVNFYIDNSPLSKERIDYAFINAKRADYYDQMKKKEEAEQLKKAREQNSKKQV